MDKLRLPYITIKMTNGEHLILDRNYVESKCEWREQTNRAGSYLVDKPRHI